MTTMVKGTATGLLHKEPLKHHDAFSSIQASICSD